MDDLFHDLLNRPWQESFSDSGCDDWERLWFLDGERATVRNTPSGMVFSAGPVAGDHGSHAVLWTRSSFAGDVRIECDYTRLDTINRFVNILYIQATGRGEGPYTPDITEWSHLRQVPFMSNYFDTMNLLHISYAAFGNDNDDPDDYVRARRYPTRPDRPFGSTDLPPDNFNTGFFQPGITYHFTFIKTDDHLFFEAGDDQDRQLFHWPLADVEPVAAGRIGIRHMFTRCSRYANFRIFTGG